jgi:hypothetical protein
MIDLASWLVSRLGVVGHSALLAAGQAMNRYRGTQLEFQFSIVAPQTTHSKLARLYNMIASVIDHAALQDRRPEDSDMSPACASDCPFPVNNLVAIEPTPRPRDHPRPPMAPALLLEFDLRATAGGWIRAELAHSPNQQAAAENPPGFDVFGVHVQYWMLAVLMMVVGATIVGIRSG